MIVLAAQHAAEAVMRAVEMKPLEAISERLSVRIRRREAIRELSRFSDRELGDIGIRRCDIEDIVRRPAEGRRAA